MRSASPQPTSTHCIGYKTTPPPLLNFLHLGAHLWFAFASPPIFWEAPEDDAATLEWYRANPAQGMQHSPSSLLTQGCFSAVL